MVLIPVGHLLPTPEGDAVQSPDGEVQDWPTLVNTARDQVIHTMETRLGIKGLREKIIWEEVNTPLTCMFATRNHGLMHAKLTLGVGKEKFNLAHGSILGITHDFFNVLSFRPQSRHPSIKSAYFVGASAHPGTGVPIAIAGSRLCAEAVLSDLGIPTPSCYTTQASFPIRSPTNDLDRPKPKWIRHRLESLVAEIWKHLTILVIFSLLGILIGTASAGSSDVPAGQFRPGRTAGHTTGQKESSMGWIDMLTTNGSVLVTIFLVFRYLKRECV